MSKIAAHGTGTHAEPALVKPAVASQPPVRIAPPSATVSNSSHVISNDGGSLISDAGGNQITRNSNIISQDGNGLVGGSGGTMRSVQSVDKPRAPAGKYLVIPGGNLVDANGNVVRTAGTYMLIPKNGGYGIGTGAGARTPGSGTIVTP